MVEWRRLLARLLLPLALTGAALVAAEGSPADEAPTASMSTRLERGAIAYRENCAVCHGATGTGLAEAREAFPADHRRCERCHRPGNVRVMTFEEMNKRPHDVFDVGVPPPLRGNGALQGLDDPALLRDYLRATMPRFQPGSLTDEQYLDIALFMLEGAWPDAGP